MLDETARGVFTIAVTPFLPDGAIDFASIDRMVDAYIERGATGLTILGMMGEAGPKSLSLSSGPWWRAPVYQLSSGSQPPGWPPLPR